MSDGPKWKPFGGEADVRGARPDVFSLEVPGGRLYRHLDAICFAPHSPRQLERMTSAMYRVFEAFKYFPSLGSVKLSGTDGEGLSDRQKEVLTELHEARGTHPEDVGETE